MKRTLALFLALVMCLSLFPTSASALSVPKVAGDANGDGQLNGADLIRIRKYLAGLETTIDLACADVNGDGTVNGGDLVRLRKYLAGLNVELVAPVQTDTLILLTSTAELSYGSSGTVFFYVEVNDNPSSVVLYDAANDTAVLTLVDDGLFSQSGDDLPGDSVYSGRMDLDTNQQSYYSFYAVSTIGEQTNKTNMVTISIVYGFTDADHQSMSAVESSIQAELFEIGNYDSMSVEERKTLALSILDDLVSLGYVTEGSVYSDDANGTVSFLYSSGILGTIILNNSYWHSKCAKTR